MPQQNILTTKFPFKNYARILQTSLMARNFLETAFLDALFATYSMNENESVSFQGFKG